MNLVVLGSGKSNIGENFRNTAAHLITADDTRLLLDCSDGTRMQLATLGLNSFDIDAIFFSHFHPDHFSPNCFLQDYVVRRFDNPNDILKLKIYGPKGLKEKLSKSWDAPWGEGKFKELILDSFDIEIVELADGDQIQVKDLNVTSYSVKHNAMEALAYRVEDKGGRSLAYSGDATFCNGLSAAANDTDLFLCEAALPATGPTNNELHLSAAGAAFVAKQANVKKLVLTHYSDNSQDMIESVKNADFTGAIAVANDLSKFSI